MVTAEAAADLRAPRLDGKTPLGAFDLDLAFSVWRSTALAIELYAAGATKIFGPGTPIVTAVTGNGRRAAVRASAAGA